MVRSRSVAANSHHVYLISFSLIFATAIAFNAISRTVKIVEHKVPGAVLNGSEFVVLDCLFNVRPDKTKGLFVKWYFNNENKPTYQWIAGHPPRSIGPLKSHVRLDYQVSTDDELAKYRALYITRPTIDMTGNYKCLVSTDYDEDFMIKMMTVYAPGENMHMYRTKIANRDRVNISCTIYKVFPMPNMHIYMLNGNGTRNISLPLTMYDSQNEGAYDVTVSTLFDESELPIQSVFYCALFLPSTPYNLTKKFTYVGGDTESLLADNFAWMTVPSPIMQWAFTFMCFLIFTPY